MSSELKITSFEDLKAYRDGGVVELPPFSHGQPFVARIKRPSMMKLVSKGKIPNALLVQANTLFKSSAAGLDENKLDMMKDLMDIMEVIAEASLIEPSYKEIEEAGLELSDDQLMFIFQYSQVGVKALESFRGEPSSSSVSGSTELDETSTQ